MKDVECFIVFMDRGADPITNTCQPDTFMGAYRHLIKNNAAHLLAAARVELAADNDLEVPEAEPFIPAGTEQKAYDFLVESGFLNADRGDTEINIPEGQEQAALEELHERGFHTSPSLLGESGQDPTTMTKEEVDEAHAQRVKDIFTKEPQGEPNLDPSSDPEPAAVLDPSGQPVDND